MSAGTDVTGTLLIAVGTFGLAIGVGISVTGIGAICGIPLVLISFIPFIWGMVIRAKAKRLKEEEYLQKGVDRIAQLHATSQRLIICPACQTPNENINPKCSACGTEFQPVPQKM